MLMQTPRLLIRNFKETDLASFVAYRNDTEVAKYQSWKVPYTLEMGSRFIQQMKDMNAPKQGSWMQVALALKESDELIGDLGFFINQTDIRQATIGFSIARAQWRKGFATEAILQVLNYLFFDIDLHRIVANCDVENIASYRTLEKMGFRREAHFIESFLANEVYQSEYHYGMLQREWCEKKQGDNARFG